MRMFNDRSKMTHVANVICSGKKLQMLVGLQHRGYLWKKVDTYNMYIYKYDSYDSYGHMTVS